jgi:hypothetical protein
MISRYLRLASCREVGWGGFWREGKNPAVISYRVESCIGVFLLSLFRRLKALFLLLVIFTGG